MSNDLWQGLWISGVGLALLFVAMGLLTLVMLLLERVLRNDSSLGESGKKPPPKQESAPKAADEEVAVAIATAIAYLRARERRQSNLGSTLEAGPGSWWAAGRRQQNPSITLQTPKRRNEI